MRQCAICFWPGLLLPNVHKFRQAPETASFHSQSQVFRLAFCCCVCRGAGHLVQLGLVQPQSLGYLELGDLGTARLVVFHKGEEETGSSFQDVHVGGEAAVLQDQRAAVLLCFY